MRKRFHFEKVHDERNLSIVWNIEAEHLLKLVNQYKMCIFLWQPYTQKVVISIWVTPQIVGLLLWLQRLQNLLVSGCAWVEAPCLFGRQGWSGTIHWRWNSYERLWRTHNLLHLHFKVLNLRVNLQTMCESGRKWRWEELFRWSATWIEENSEAKTTKNLKTTH